MTGIIICLLLSAVSVIAIFIVGITEGKGGGRYVPSDPLVEPMYMHPFETDTNDVHELKEPKQDDHFIEKAAYMVHMENTWTK